MSRTAHPLARCFLALALWQISALVQTIPERADANPIPDGMLYFNIRPAGPPEQYCATDITNCDELVPSTEDEGLLEFQIFIDPQQHWFGEIPVPYLRADLSWPDAWTLVDFGICRDPFSWWFDTSGPGPHRLEIEGPCTIPGPLFLAATLVFDVRDYGRLDTGESPVLWYGCPVTAEVYPTAHYAEAGTGCEYTDQPCVQWDFRCIPEVSGLEVLLTAPEGGSAHGELAFDISGYPYPPCEMTVHSDADWATGYVTLEGMLWDGLLHVDANSSGLEPGIHQCEFQIAYDGAYNGARVRNARCLPVILTVEPASGVEDLPPRRDPSADLVLAGANPSEGPFSFTFENRATTPMICSVFDASGREIARLADEVRPKGRNAITWSGEDAAGDPVPPGVYMVRLAHDGAVRSTRVIVVR